MVLQDYLQLLEEECVELSAVPYFRIEVQIHAREVAEVIQQVITKSGSLSQPVLGQIAQNLHLATHFLKGSATNQLPYEMSFALELALSDCFSPAPVVTTALLGMGDFFLASDPVKPIAEMLGSNLTTNHVHIGLPALFRHRPIMLAPLYHEAGHYVDNQKEISGTAFLGMSTNSQIISHLKEHFADLFAACYIGDSIACFLEEFAAGNNTSSTHPSTNDRVNIIRKYLAGNRTDPLIRLLISSANIRGVDINTTRCIEVNVKDSFDDRKPVQIDSTDKVHGLIYSAANYLRDNNGSDIDTRKIRTTINDLTERSIRSVMIRQQWEQATHQ